jgi:hypothetical protein
MKRLIVISALALAVTGCIQDKIDDAKEDCQQSADDALRWAQESCEQYLDEALAEFWKQLDKEVEHTFAEIGCVKIGPGDFELDCSNTFLCPDNGEI